MAINIFKKPSSAKVQASKGKKEQKIIMAKERPTETRGPKEKRIDLAWHVLKNAHVTEKATDLTEHNKYIFNVFPRSNKKEIKIAVENVYGVDVVSVNIINIPPKKRRLGKNQGWRLGYKKAVVGIKSGQKLEIMPR